MQHQQLENLLDRFASWWEEPQVADKKQAPLEKQKRKGNRDRLVHLAITRKFRCLAEAPPKHP
jgi:hypothetical protein